jgi:hypothetical protein
MTVLARLLSCRVWEKAKYIGRIQPLSRSSESHHPFARLICLSKAGYRLPYLRILANDSTPQTSRTHGVALITSKVLSAALPSIASPPAPRLRGRKLRGGRLAAYCSIRLSRRSSALPQAGFREAQLAGNTLLVIRNTP